MPAQEERITALEQKTAAHIQEMDENFTIMVGVIRHQGQDIKRISQRLDTMDESLHSVNQRLETIDTSMSTFKQHLETVDESLHSLKQQNSQFEIILNDHTTLLSQILARLPKTPE
jgi:chromosome segregation ATPase